MVKMNDQNYEELKEQLEQYKEEKERVRKIVGQIGGRKGLHYQKVTNQIFLLIVILVFILSTIFKTISYNLGLEIGILLACIKIIWLISDQQKINHFQFWILSSLELKINELEKNYKSNQNK
jgi:hypothetical protein